MSVVNMFSFDQFPTRALTQAMLDAEDYSLMAMNWSLGTLDVATLNGRQWCASTFSYIGVTQPSWRWTRLASGKTFRQAFGNPSVITKGVIAARIFITATGKAIFDTAYATTSSFFWNQSLSVDGNMLGNIPAGEHFIECEFDFVNLKTRSYLNGALFAESSVPSLTLDQTFTLGFHAMYPGSGPSGVIGYTTDLYFTYDNQDGEIAGRLGPVKVYNTPVEEIEIPQSWKGVDEFVQTYNLRDGGTWDACTIVPRFTSEGDFTNQFKIETTPPLSVGAPASMMAESNTRNYWTGVGGNTVFTLNIAFTEPKKVSGYVIQSWNTVGCFDTWKFQGSNDGTSWVDLDTRSGQNAYFVAQTNRVVAFKLAPDKVGSYKQCRLVVTVSVASSGSVSVMQFNLLGEPADIFENNVRPALSRIANTSLTDYDFPVMRAAIDESEGAVGFKIPEIGPADILAVKVGIVARKDQGSSEHLVAKIKVGANETTPVDYTLKSHAEGILPLAMLQKAPGGAAWTKEALESLRVVMKTKRGAN
ncbi:hypothetical protein D3C75_509560 [compost metagenome]